LGGGLGVRRDGVSTNVVDSLPDREDEGFSHRSSGIHGEEGAFYSGHGSNPLRRGKRGRGESINGLESESDSTRPPFAGGNVPVGNDVEGRDEGGNVELGGLKGPGANFRILPRGMEGSFPGNGIDKKVNGPSRDSAESSSPPPRTVGVPTTSGSVIPGYRTFFVRKGILDQSRERIGRPIDGRRGRGRRREANLRSTEDLSTVGKCRGGGHFERMAKGSRGFKGWRLRRGENGRRSGWLTQGPS
jgi:hypothetical protein